MPSAPLPPLPIDELLPELLASLKARPGLVLSAEPGAGKTTRVPRALLDAGLLGDGECWILEPRRLAARLAAGRVAEELGEPLGRRAGYAVRFEQKVSPETRLRFVTEGLLLRRLQSDPLLRGISAVVLDEFHERHLHTDLALALLRRLQRGPRPELKLLVMSATLDAEPVAAYLDAPVLRSRGRSFPIEQRHLPRPDSRPLAAAVAEEAERLYAEGLAGHSLVFLPGAAEIRACLQACEGLAARRDLRLFPLHGELSPEAQQAALAPSPRPKLIFSTNVAESSVTLEGIAAVIDSGLAREARHSPWSGLSALATARISQARCVQRAGRAGRTGPGLCLRLFPEADFLARPAFDTPELQRADLSEALLGLHALGLGPGGLDWFEAPPEAALRAAEKLLRDLGALEGEGLSAAGRRMLELPLHPRLARLVVAGEEEGIPSTARLAAALIEAGELGARQSLERRSEPKGAVADSDLLLRLDQYREAEAAAFSAGACRAAGLDPAAVHRAKQAFHQLRGPRIEEPADAEERLRRALLRAYPDRVASKGAGRSYSLSEGGGATLDPASRVKAELLLALDAAASGASVSIRLASKLEPEWLLEAFPERIREVDEVVFNTERGRVERVAGLWYGQARLDESRRAADPEDPRAAPLLAEALLAKGLGEAQEQLDRLLARAAFLAEQRPELELPEAPELRRRLAVRACAGCVSLKELAQQDWAWLLKEELGPDASRLLESWAPEAVQLAKGRPVKVNYGGEAPWIESRLQDFWGMKKGPAIAGGAVPLVLHLLAPNYRAVQVTTDLAGFWQRAYKELRPALSRRYPKHHWPE